MKELIENLQEIKERKTNALERTIIFKQFEKQYNIWYSDIIDIYFNL